VGNVQIPAGALAEGDQVLPGVLQGLQLLPQGGNRHLIREDGEGGNRQASQVQNCRQFIICDSWLAFHYNEINDHF